MRFEFRACIRSGDLGRVFAVFWRGSRFCASFRRVCVAVGARICAERFNGG
jgi:hypothetical protein